MATLIGYISVDWRRIGFGATTTTDRLVYCSQDIHQLPNQFRSSFSSSAPVTRVIKGSQTNDRRRIHTFECFYSCYYTLEDAIDSATVFLLYLSGGDCVCKRCAL